MIFRLRHIDDLPAAMAANIRRHLVNGETEWNTTVYQYRLEHHWYDDVHHQVLARYRRQLDGDVDWLSEPTYISLEGEYDELL